MKCPYKYKHELIQWASNYFQMPTKKFAKMKKKQLYAIFYNAKKEMKQFKNTNNKIMFVFCSDSGDVFKPMIKISENEYIDCKNKCITVIKNTNKEIRIVKPPELKVRWKLPVAAYNDLIFNYIKRIK